MHAALVRIVSVFEREEKRGKSNLLDGKCQTANATIWGYVDKPKPSSSVASAIEELVVESTVEFLARDVRSFEGIAGQGMRTLTPCFRNISSLW